MWRGLLALGVLESIGIAAVTIVCRRQDRWGTIATAGLGFGVGLVVLTLSSFLASLCGLRPVWWFGTVEMLVLLSVAVALRRDRLRAWRLAWPHAPWRAEPGWVRISEVALGLFIVTLCLVVSTVSLLEPLAEWDVIAIWALKAKVLLHEAIADSAYFSDVSKAFSHLDYPLLWPLAMTWVWAWTGHAELEVVKLLGPALLCALLATFYGILRRHHERRLALLFTALLAGVPMLLSQTSRLMSDPALAYFSTGAVGCCYVWLRSPDTGDDLRLAALFATGMLFTKNEGVGLLTLLVVAAAGVLLLRGDVRRSVSVIVWLGVVPLLLTAFWFVFRMDIPKVVEDYGGRIDPSYAWQNVSRLPQVFWAAFRYWGDFTDWLGLWPLTIAVVALGIKQCLRYPVNMLLAWVGLSLMMYGYVFVVTPWDPTDLMEVAANRLLVHVAPLAVLLVAEVTASMLDAGSDSSSCREAGRSRTLSRLVR